MLLKEGITLHPYDKNQWVLHIANGRNFIISEEMQCMLAVLQNSDTIIQAHERYKFVSSQSLSYLEFEYLVLKKLKGYDILAADTSQIARPKDYMWFKLKIIPPHFLEKLSVIFQPLLIPSFFWIILPLVSICGLMSYFLLPSDALAAPSNYYFILLLTAVLPISHELGHIAACTRLRIPTGGIGIGMYMFWPVLYADISQIWIASKEHRIIANLAGVYMQLIIGVILVACYLLSQNLIFVTVAKFNILIAAWQLFPFMRHDGYWVLSDGLGIPNLMAKSDVTLFNFIKSPKVILNKPFNKFLILYGLLNNALLTYFIYNGFVMYFDTVKEIPIALYTSIITYISTNTITLPNLEWKWLYAILFYLSMYSMIVKILKIIYKKIFRKGDAVLNQADAVTF